MATGLGSVHWQCHDGRGPLELVQSWNLGLSNNRNTVPIISATNVYIEAFGQSYYNYYNKKIIPPCNNRVKQRLKWNIRTCVIEILSTEKKSDIQGDNRDIEPQRNFCIVGRGCQYSSESLTHSLTGSLTGSQTGSLTHWLVHWLAHRLAHWLTDSLTH